MRLLLLFIIAEVLTLAICDDTNIGVISWIIRNITESTEDDITQTATERNENVSTECGWNNPDINTYTPKISIQSAPIASYGDFPWMVALMRKIDDSTGWSQADYLGGGTLIHPSAVITVAHKFKIKKKILDATEVKCIAGEYDTQLTAKPFPTQERDVAKYIIHENYCRDSLYNDIALLFLKKPFELEGAPHIGTACLAKALPTDGRDCYSMGWGKHFNDKKKFSVILKKVKLQFVVHKRCEGMLINNTRMGKGPFELHESLTCANGETGADTCMGDGGSPLVCPISENGGKTQYAVYGLVAYGVSCGDPLAPAVYANVPHLKSWIDGKMQQEGFDDQYYSFDGDKSSPSGDH